MREYANRLVFGSVGGEKISRVEKNARRSNETQKCRLRGGRVCRREKNFGKKRPGRRRDLKRHWSSGLRVILNRF